MKNNKNEFSEFIEEHRRDIVKLMFMKERERKKKLNQLFYYFRRIDTKEMTKHEPFNLSRLILLMNLNEMFLNYSRQINVLVLKHIKTYETSRYPL